MKIIFKPVLLILLLILCFFTPAQGQATDIWGGVTGGYFFARNFVYDNNGYIFGSTSSGVERSTDGGSSWNPVTSGIGQLDIGALDVSTSGVIYALAYGTNSISQNSNMLFKSTNGGSYWSKVYEFSVGSNINARCYSMKVNNSNGYLYICAYSLAEYKGVLLYSSNNGVTWTEPANSGLNVIPTCIDFLSSGDILVGSTTCSSAMYRTSDNGDSWTSTSQSVCEVYQIYTSPYNGKLYAPSRDGMFRSSDNGYSWTNIDPNHAYTSVVTNSIGYIYGGAYTTGWGDYPGVLRSKDNGSTWQDYTTGLGQYYMFYPTLFITADSYLLAAADYYSDDGGWVGVYRTLDPTVQQITVSDPASGTVWGVGSYQTINWSSIGITGNVNIKLSLDGGSSFPLSLAAGIYNDNSQTILVPNNPATQAVIRVESVSNPAVFGLSPGVFSIVTPEINITAPAANANWPSGSPQIIQWTSKGVSSLYLEYSTDNGINWIAIASSVDANLGSYSWTLPDSISSNALIRISDMGYSGAVGQSNLFNMQGLKLISPAGGESWTIGSDQNIKWISAGIDNLKISCTYTDDSGWQTISASASAAPQSYTWTIPGTVSSTAKIKVEDIDNAAFVNQSANVFATVLNKVVLLTPVTNSPDIPISISCKWNQVSGATAYYLQVTTDPNFIDNLVVNDSTLSDTSITVSSLDNNTQYYWRVRASNSTGTGKFSDTFTFTTIIALPGTPQLIAPSNAQANTSATGLTFAWTRASDAAAYQLQISEDVNFLTDVFTNDSTITDTIKILSGLANKTKYYWHVRSRNMAGTSDYSSINTFTTIIAVPSSPLQIEPATGSENQKINDLKLIWGSTNETDTYHLQVSMNENFLDGMIVNDSTLTDTSYMLTGLSNSGIFYWRVRAKNLAGFGDFSGGFDFTTIVSIPATTTLIEPADHSSDLHPTNLTLAWVQVKDAENYQLQLGKVETFLTGIYLNDSTLTDTSQIVNGLENNMQYYWRVRSKNIAGSGSYSDIFTFTTIISQPPVPSLVEPQSGSLDQPLTNLKLIWKSANGAEHYYLQISKDQNFLTTEVCNDSTLTDTVYTLNDLLTATTYYWRVGAKNKGGCSEFSGTYTFNTQLADDLSLFDLKDKIRFFPNPASGVIYIEGIESGNVKISVYSMEGYLLKEFKGKSLKEIDVLDLQNGVYLIRLESLNGIISRKVTIVH